ncbi:MAG: hypothetical protein AB7S70_09185 [Hyphomicrobium sp.]|uniref:hypothetical protein n=1 Tax=Hyphomicrobium sp. TaxID=82 RepID=UPI003D128061
MLGFRFDPPGPFWFEDLAYFVIDESARLALRARRAAVAVAEWARRTHDAIITFPDRVIEAARLRTSPAPDTTRLIVEVAPLEEPEAWALATEPLTALGNGTSRTLALHKSATDQLDALTYVLAQMRDDLRAVMSYAPLEGEEPVRIPTQAELDVSIEALLALSRQNAATRPKDRLASAA